MSVASPPRPRVSSPASRHLVEERPLRYPDTGSRAVMITFDDCNEQIYTQAFPILQKYGIKATVNVIGYYIEYHDNYDQPLLTWDELAEMTASGETSIQKINSAYEIGGAKTAKKTVSKLLNIPINYYLTLNMLVAV